MKYLVQDCNCEDFPCCVHADNYAVPVQEFEQDSPETFECDSTCCECSLFDECDVHECDYWHKCEHRECGIGE